MAVWRGVRSHVGFKKDVKDEGRMSEEGTKNKMVVRAVLGGKDRLVYDKLRKRKEKEKREEDSW